MDGGQLADSLCPLPVLLWFQHLGLCPHLIEIAFSLDSYSLYSELGSTFTQMKSCWKFAYGLYWPSALWYSMDRIPFC